jgi:hypothetical protein
MGITKIHQAFYQQLTDQAVVLATHRDRPAVMLTPDQKIIKHIYRRGWWSSSTLWPYAVRFKENAASLKTLGISCPAVEAIYHYPSQKCDLVIYPFVTGSSVHQTAITGDYQTLEKLPTFLNKLHSLGIYFHDLHLGNVIYHKTEFSLVDIASVCIYPKTLAEKYREKNLKHLFDKQEDKPIFEKYGIDRFLEVYYSV